MALLITPTLMDSHDWLLKCPQSWKEKAYNDLSNTLNRAKWEPNEAVKQGIKFEKIVYKYANHPDRERLLSLMGASKYFISVCNQLTGYYFHQKGKKIVTIDGVEYCIYGRYDAIRKAEKIIDLKTTKKFTKKNYLSKWQHRFYTYVEKIKHFEYIVAEWNDVENNDYSIKEIHNVKYEAENFEEIEKELFNKIEVFISFINEDENLKDAYYNKYNLY